MAQPTGEAVFATVEAGLVNLAVRGQEEPRRRREFQEVVVHRGRKFIGAGQQDGAAGPHQRQVVIRKTHESAIWRIRAGQSKIIKSAPSQHQNRWQVDYTALAVGRQAAGA